MNTNANTVKLRVHIAPVGFEIDRIIVPAINMRADKVWLIGHSNLSEDKARPFLDKIRKTLAKKNIQVKEVVANRFRLFDIVKTVKEIIFEEQNNDVYLNVASGSKIHAVGMMMATMIFDDRSNLHPFYAQAKEYHHTKLSEPQTSGIEAIHDLPTYRIQTPAKKHLEALRILVENGVIDRVDQTPEGDYVVIDYKTGHSTPTKVPDSLQLNLYCMAIQEKFGKLPTLASFFYVEEPEGGQWFHYNVTPEKVAEVKLKLEEHVDAISKDQFDATPGFACKWCSYRDICEEAM